ncbi:MAG TPA: hypothetical protein VLA16_20505 [Ideonella sp.]|nr:hypothetical protein [Ideonella sp.]
MNARLHPLARTLLALAVASTAALAHAGETAWIDWTTQTGSTVTGTLTLPSGIVKVKFSGPSLYFSLTAPGSSDYWVSGTPDAYAATGEPTGSDALAFVGGTGTQLYKVSFSKPVTNPVMAVMSLGRAGLPARYVFTQKPTLLSSGVGFYGGCTTCLKVSKKTLTGSEGHGVVQFTGSFSSISWQQPDHEYWHALTLGAPLAGN